MLEELLDEEVDEDVDEDEELELLEDVDEDEEEEDEEEDVDEELDEVDVVDGCAGPGAGVIAGRRSLTPQCKSASRRGVPLTIRAGCRLGPISIAGLVGVACICGLGLRRNGKDLVRAQPGLQLAVHAPGLDFVEHFGLYSYAGDSKEWRGKKNVSFPEGNEQACSGNTESDRVVARG